jgi:aminoglycoside phosphotransferase (APT) family kinase protein
VPCHRRPPVGPAAQGLGWLLPERGVPAVVADQLATYRQGSTHYLRGAEPPLLVAALDWLDAHPPTDRSAALTRGDARLGNMVFAYGRTAAVLD